MVFFQRLFSFVLFFLPKLENISDDAYYFLTLHSAPNCPVQRSSFKETLAFEESRHLAGSAYWKVFVREGRETEKVRERKREGTPSTWKSC